MVASTTMRLIKTIILFTFISASTYAQQGSYYLAQYDLSQRNISNYNFDLTQDSHGLVYLANLKGVVVTDGLEWSLAETPFSVFALGLDSLRNIYVGGKREIGIVNISKKGKQAYHAISSVPQQIVDIKFHDGFIYFMMENNLMVYDVNTQKLNIVELSKEDPLLRMVAADNKLYVVSEKKGFQLLKGTKLISESLNLPKGTIGLETSDYGAMVAFTQDGNYFIKKAKEASFDSLQIKDKGYLSENTPVDLQWVNENLIAIATLSGGVVFVNAQTGNVEQYMNYTNGLADNEIRTLFVSQNKVVWCSTPKGISIIAPEIPIRNFASYKGLQGSIEVVHKFNNYLYVGTTTGLYRLVKNKVYQDVVSYKTKTKTEYIQGEEIVPQKKGLFKRKKTKRKKPVLIARNKKVTTKKVEKKLLSENYTFEKIDSISTKVNQLVAYDNSLIVGSLGGVYAIQDGVVKKIYDQPVVYLYKPNQLNVLMISTYDGQVKVLKPNNNSWQETGLLDGLKDFVEQIQEGNKGSLWLCGADSVYRLELSNEQTLEDVEVFPINNPYWERVYASRYKGKIYFLNTSGYYYYENHKIHKDSLIAKKIGLPRQMILSANNKLWVNTGHFWYGQSKDLNNSLNFVSLFEDPKYIAEEENSTYWLVAGNNQLYSIDGNRMAHLTRKFDLFLKAAQKDSLLLPPTPVLGKIDQQSLLSFTFSSPDYTNIYQTEYQYRLVGLSKEWSEWKQTNNQISFPYLPAGSYTLEVKARDALGNVQTANPIKFTILAPYWKRPWFYLTELLFFGGFMALSIFINRKKHKFTVLSRLLTFLTLILIVEFVQTIAEAKFETNQSPVINFFIQVVIALSILPVESVLRGFITNRKITITDAASLNKAKQKPSEKDHATDKA